MHKEEPIIQVKGISKKYVIRHETAPYKTFQDAIINALKAPINLIKNNGGLPKKETFWALKDITFDVNKGEAVGIIGRNGAGKSTLLKVLSRITEPTEGRITLRGRVASLLEVGTGFHPELTGRENIYLNGSVLGMTKKEINSKFDEIVEFSGVETFLDTPVKRYSSGMYVRLAFAVAAHLEPEILLVDEVLSVGDAEFQKKCLGKMKDVSEGGRTVLFVSHNMGAIQNLCERCILLEEGSINAIGDTRDIIGKYLLQSDNLSKISIEKRVDRKGKGILRFINIEFQDADGKVVNSFISGKEANIVLEYTSKSNGYLKNVSVAIGVDNSEGVRVTHLYNDVTGDAFNSIPPHGKIVCCIPKLPLTSGRYTFTIFATVNSEIADWIVNAANFDVVLEDFFGTGRTAPKGQGNFIISHKWYIK